MSNEVENTNQGRTARLVQVLEQLAARGVKQRELAFALNIPTQYLSDLKHGRRTVGENFARRFAEAYRISAAWILHGEGPRDLPDLVAAPTQADRDLPASRTLVPDQGDPRHSPHWDGGLLVLSGAAAAAAERAKLPFVLRIGADITSGRLKKNDLVLCSQELRDDATMVIVRKGKAVLARAVGKGSFQTLASGGSIPGADPIGCCLGIVWAPLS